MRTTCITEQTKRRLTMLHAKCRSYNDNPATIPLEERETLAMMFSSTFREFSEFAELGMKYLGFDTSDIQMDIAKYMQYGKTKRMIQAQRGQAKSTLAALYCVWLLINNPSARILVVSGGEKQASDVALLIVRIIMNWSILCWLRPDASRGDRTSSGAFDMHCDLKGIEKSASITSVGITSNFTGSRADFILADDIETPRNSMTQTEREKLLQLTKEFAALCITGAILYLGTPQTKDSIYRALPARGYDVRVWCGRYPTKEELERYSAGVTIAPMIMEKLQADPTLQEGGGITGKRGKPTDPTYITELVLQEKELEYGEEGFNLQYMLDTTLSDALRTKIKLSDMLILGCNKDSVPETLQYNADPQRLFKDSTPPISDSRMYWAAGVSDVFIPFEHKIMTLDPAGSGGDELSYAVGGATNSYIYLLSLGGFAGGMTEANMNSVLMKMLEYGVKVLDIEQNMGHGTVLMLFLAQLDKLKNWALQKHDDILPMLAKTDMTHQQFHAALSGIGVTQYYSVGQKERRIIDTISPITRRHKLVVALSAIQEDWEHCQQHSSEKRIQFSALYQLANITYDRGSLVHDDRADCIQRLVEVLKGFLAKDDEKAAIKRVEQAAASWVANPMGYPKSLLNEGRARKRITGRRR